MADQLERQWGNELDWRLDVGKDQPSEHLLEKVLAHVWEKWLALQLDLRWVKMSAHEWGKAWAREKGKTLDQRLEGE